MNNSQKAGREARPLSNLERVRRYRRRQRERNKLDVLVWLRTATLYGWIEVLARSADATLADLARAIRDQQHGAPFQEPHAHTLEES